MAAEHLDTPSILIDHEKRISTMEGTLEQMNRRLGNIEGYLRWGLGIIIGGFLAIFGSIIGLFFQLPQIPGN